MEETEKKLKKEKWTKIIKRKENIIRDLWDNIKCPNIEIIGIPEEDKRNEREKAWKWKWTRSIVSNS